MDEKDILIINIGEDIPPLKIVYENLSGNKDKYNSIEELINDIKPV